MYQEAGVMALIVNFVIVVVMLVIYKTKIYKTRRKMASLLVVCLFFIATVVYVVPKILAWV
ncbi:hypothetical protein BMT55_04190 [Listeria newyorkensis]|uniref:Uncharacterized protein n=1 Tax=Listeria newyorkensis TaxID=1497681 RepID=A0ABX4XR78_9LIST|nr:hypothetical protein [Listeria newyorkensis]KGL41908.1 hypothetical protein EP58_10215 [Listeria newyorkensis]PNP93972.1 hypothetical protein BMT55_04190 [Listeria newyorkensis]WAO22598.1 hypothetical protein OTR81_04825 [Listeria newyorkensis]SQC51392.1 Uncharacterised protein [Listeria newyorkensis]